MKESEDTKIVWYTIVKSSVMLAHPQGFDNTQIH